MNTYSVAHVVEWNRSGQACFALLKGSDVVARFATNREARDALKAARAPQSHAAATLAAGAL